MAKKFIPVGGGNANQKIVMVNQKQGFGNMSNQQGTTRVIFDSIKLATNTEPTIVTLFEDCKNRTFPQTNLPQNRLEVGETMAMQRFSVFLMLVNAGQPKQVTQTMPLSWFPLSWRLYAGLLNFSIAQDTVIKQLPLTSMQAQFNPNSKFQGIHQFNNTNATTGKLETNINNQDIYHFDTNLIIPPQIEFKATIQIPPLDLSGLPTSDFYLVMKIEGLGSLYAPKSTY